MGEATRKFVMAFLLAIAAASIPNFIGICIWAQALFPSRTPVTIKGEVGTSLAFSPTALGLKSVQNLALSVNTSLVISSITVPQLEGGMQQFTVETVKGCMIDGLLVTSAGSLCTVSVAFQPEYPGVHKAMLVVQTNKGTFTFDLAGIGEGAQTSPLTLRSALSGNPQQAGVSENTANPAPTINALSPASTTARGGAFTLTVNGANFVSNSVVYWNGTAQTTTYVSGTQLTATITTADIAAVGAFPVTVFTPSPGGGMSNALMFTVSNPPPKVETSGAALNVAASVITVSGFVNPNGSAATYWFEYSTLEAFSKVIQTSQQTLSAATNQIAVSTSVTGLVPHTTYYFRIVAQNSFGTSQGQILKFQSSGAGERGATATLLISTTGAGGGTVTPAPLGSICGPGCYAYESGTSVTLTPVPNTGSVFADWAGACTGKSNSCQLIVNTTQPVLATFVPGSASTFALTTATVGNGSGTVTPSPVGTSCGTNCYTYPSGTAVTVATTPATGSGFASWTGDCTGSGSCSVTMTSNHSVTAAFALKTFNLSISTTGGTGTGWVAPNPSGTSCGTNCYTYNWGTVVSLGATSAAGSLFESWSGACSGAVCRVTMNANQTVTATFVTALNLTISSAGAGTGSVTLNPVGIRCGVGCYTYMSGTAVTLTAVAAAGSVFAGWTGAGCSGTGVCSIKIAANQTVIATFALQTFNLTILYAGKGTGTVAPNPIGTSCGTGCYSYTIGTTVTLTATAGAGSGFADWTGAGCSDTSTCTVTMNSNQSVTATFTNSPLTITTTSLPGATQNTTYSQIISATGGVPPYIFSLASGSLPNGLLIATINNQGLISGTPTATGTFTFTIQARDSSSPQLSTTQAYTLPVSTSVAGSAPRLTIADLSLPVAIIGSAYTTNLIALGGTAPYTWSAATWSPDSPDNGDNGLLLGSSTGTLSAKPTATGTIPLLVQLEDASAAESIVQYDFQVGGTGSPRAITNTPPGGTQGLSYTFTFTTSWSGIYCAPTLNVIGGVIPPGLSLQTLPPLKLTGIPLIAGEFTFTLSAYDDSGCLPSPNYTNAQTFTVNIAPADNPNSPPGASNWVRQFPSTPVLASTASAWDSFAVRSPSVVKVGTTFIMYYEGEDSATHTRGIGRAVSSDGINWTKSPSSPVLIPGLAGAFDSLEVRYPSIYFDGSIYRMWYWAASPSSCNSIGFATSPDGITWTKQPGPLSLGSCDFASNYAPGSVIFNSGTYTMRYWVPLGAIGVATSSDGVNWTDKGLANLGDYSMSATQGGSILHPVVVKDGTTYRMWFSKHYGYVATGDAAGFDIYKINIGSATSNDGMNWNVFSDSNGYAVSIFVPGPEGAWDRPGVGDAAVIKDGTTFKMWYTGGRLNMPVPGYYAFVEGAIGYATAE